jgi:quinoprotein glucose dehydrogenase
MIIRPLLLLCACGVPSVVIAQAGHKKTTMELTATEWASESLLGSPVAISIDHLGRAYITQTTRRKESELDIRSHTDWVTATLALESVQDRENFYRAQMSAARSEQNKRWLKDRNGDGISDFRDLGVLSEKILRIEDQSGKGVADHSEVFVDGLNNEMVGVAAGVMSYDGAVYLAAIPSVWKFDENRRPGAADPKKEQMLTGFGVHIAYSGHDMHGFTVGPDGRIYWSIGDKGVNVTLPDGTQQKYAHQGCVMRCEPDGSHFEIFAHGLRNPQEIAFDQWGNLFAVDNDGDFKGERERFVYITEQSDTGWRCNWQYRGAGYNPWMDEKLAVPTWKGQAAYITPTLLNYSDGPCGFTYNPGSALGEKWRDTFFVTQFPGRKLTAFQTEAQGASFRMVNERLVFSGPMMTGLSWGPDGALYVADWNSAAWEPHDKGKIWKLDVPEADRNSERADTKKLLAAGLKGKSVAELAALLAYDDQRVRLAAQFALVKQNQGQVLLSIAQKNESLLARVHAIWGLGQMGRIDVKNVMPLVDLLKDADPEIRSQCAKVLGDASAKAAATALLALLADSSPRVRFHAAIALAKTAGPQAIPAVATMLQKNGDNDVFLRHAGITTLAGVAKTSPQELGKLATFPDEQVRLSAVVALRRLAAPEVRVFLQDASPIVVAEAARAIHDDDSIPAALPDLAMLLEKTTSHDPVILRRAISANLRIGNVDSAQRLATFAANLKAPEAMRQEALASLALWTKADPLDRVEGRYRPLPERPASELHPALQKAAATLLGDKSEDIRVSTCLLISHSAFAEANPALSRIVHDDAQTPTTRQAALRALATVKAPELAAATELAIKSSDAKLRNEALTIMASTGKVSRDVLPLISTILQKGKEREKQDAYAVLGAIKTAEATSLLSQHLDLLLDGKVPESLRLDLLEAAKANAAKELLDKITSYQQSKKSSDALAAFREALTGGNAEKGKQLALNHLAAQCTRCHKVGGEGAEVGPDLSKVSARLSREKLLASMILPNQELAKGYALIVVTLKDGKTFSGNVENETATELPLRGADGSLVKIDKATIANRTVAASMMPPMDAMLTPREIRDVIEYLTTLK